MALRTRSELQNISLFSNTFNTQIRCLHIHEYQSQKLMKQKGIPIPMGQLVRSKRAGQVMMQRPQTLRGKRKFSEITHETWGKDRIKVLLRYIRETTGQKDHRDLTIPLYMEKFVEHEEKWRLTMAVDRERYRPIIKIRDTKDPQGLPNALYERAFQEVFEFSLSTGITEELLSDIAQSFHLGKDSRDSLREVIRRLFSIFREKDALSLETDLLFLKDGKFMCNNSDFFFDDAARERQRKLFFLRDKKQEIPEELRAEKHGLVYVHMDGNIGNVVNGAGLAMATNDAISLYGGSSANFLDAGGQATKETMLQAFKIIMSDMRVKVILVNIYGGITRCDMIAESIIAAASELGPLKVPMVVRLQGTNSEAGLKLLKDATLNIHVEADFGKAAQEAVRLADIGAKAES
ncbi:hypothetical protein AU210_004574 [Fusarium oxysporum f. sp. radicis-cucumerinum]|uniref:ATP-citrate synthase/succinyl-CoA ligase C-terminal domain-containing protein n=1 Tax=Fusarium oxysporum f. sp. radicis-cucumerinum TaxID=327505 RepID=A0A2H3HN47_FUSOX|nr:hypothetical protein AU210_004574 [Fusarium oxysporum f. sp. radicis-cucumerinum]